MGLWYLKIGQFSMMSFLNADYTGCRVDRKSTSGTCQFLRNFLVSCFLRNKIPQPSQLPRRSMLRPGLVVHKSFGWNILSLTMIYIMTILKYFVIILALLIWQKIQINIARSSTWIFDTTFLDITMRKTILKLICFHWFSTCGHFY